MLDQPKISPTVAAFRGLLVVAAGAATHGVIADEPKADVPVVATAPAPAPTTPPRRPEQVRDPRRFDTPGDRVLFQPAKGNPRIGLAPDRGTLESFDAALLRGDRRKMQALIDGGAFLFVAPSTPGEILEAADVLRKVRVSGGPFAGKEGWIEEAFLRAEPPPGLIDRAREERAREVDRRKEARAKKEGRPTATGRRS